MSKKLFVYALVLMLGLPVLYYFSPFDYFSPGSKGYFSPEAKEARLVDKLVTRNIDARGGADAWQAVSSLRLSGLMDVGQGMHLPYVLEQKRPGKMCLEFVFADETAVQCVDGKTGWKIAPFRGRTTPEPMTASELREAVDTGDPYGLLYDHAARGHVIKILGHETVEGRDTFKLQVTLPGGAVRWIYLDAETALEVKLEARRKLVGRELLVETFYHDWQATDGLLIPRRQETRTAGDDELHFITVDQVEVNPSLDDLRFVIPSSIGASNASTQKASS
jgi:hypothetical protein